MIMSSKEYVGMRSDLKELLEFAYRHDEQLKKQNTHLCKLNGKVAKHELTFVEVYKLFNDNLLNQNDKFWGLKLQIMALGLGSGLLGASGLPFITKLFGV